MTWVPFESMEDAFTMMAQAEDAANDRITDEQRLIQPGDYVLRMADFGGAPFLIVGHTFTMAETRERESKYTTDPEELDEAMAGVEDRWHRGYIFGQWHSLIEPEGELGDAHISTLLLMQKQTFDMLLDLIRNGQDPLKLL